MVDAVLEQTCRTQRRVRVLPARVVGYLLLAGCLSAPSLDPLARGELIVEATTAQDFARIADLVRQYANFPLVTADASVIAAAERLGATYGFRAVVRPCRSCRRSVGCGRAGP